MDIQPFYAARLVDESYAVELPLYYVDTTSEGAFAESIDSIRTSARPQMEKEYMLGYVKHMAKDLVDESFDPINERDAVCKIAVTKDSYPLIYEALDQLVLVPIAKKEKEEMTLGESMASQPEAEQAVDRTEELTKQVETLNHTIEEQETKITELTKNLAEYAAFKHELKAREAAQLSIEAGRAYAVDKTLDEVVEYLAVRSDASLDDTISDIKFELEAKAAKSAEPVNSPVAPNMEEVKEQLADIKPEAKAEGNSIASIYKIFLGADKASDILNRK